MQGVCNVYLLLVQRDQIGYAYQLDGGRQKFPMHWKTLTERLYNYVSLFPLLCQRLPWNSPAYIP